MALTLPYPSLVFVPLDILTAEEQNQIVANYTYIANQFPVGASNINFATPTEDDNGWYKLRLAGKLCAWFKQVAVSQRTFQASFWGSFDISNGPSEINKMYSGTASSLADDRAVLTSAMIIGENMTSGVEPAVTISWHNIYSEQVTTRVVCKAIIIGEEA